MNVNLQNPCTLDEHNVRTSHFQMFIEDFDLPFEGMLDAGNRWVKLANLILPVPSSSLYSCPK
jgi:hypothetical protein